MYVWLIPKEMLQVGLPRTWIPEQIKRQHQKVVVEVVVLVVVGGVVAVVVVAVAAAVVVVQKGRFQNTQSKRKSSRSLNLGEEWEQNPHKRNGESSLYPKQKAQRVVF